MRTRTTAAALTLAAAVAFTVTGCSSSSNDDASPAPAASTTAGQPATAKADGSDKDALTAAVKAYSAAYFKPDAGAARALLSDRCKAKAPEADYKAALQEAVSTYGHQEVESVTVDRLSGDVGVVSYTYSVPALNQKAQAWAREGGAWRYDAC